MKFAVPTHYIAHLPASKLSLEETVPLTVKKKSQLGLRYIGNLNSYSSCIVALIVVLGSIRGMAVINLDLPARTVYNIVASLVILLSAYGYLKRGNYRHFSITSLKKLLQLNLLLGIINFVIDLFLGMPFDPAVFYVYLLPYVVFLLMRVPVSYLNVAFIIITIAICYSVLDNFIESLKGPEGFQNVYDYHVKLRPDTFEALSRTGEFYRASGYTGSYHDSANILGLTGSFFFVRYFARRQWLDLGLSLLALFSLTLTQSAANIIIAIFTCVIFGVYLLVIRRNIRLLVSLFAVVVAISMLILNFGDIITIFTMRLGADGDRAMMLNKLDINTLISALPFFLVGHAEAFKSEIISTEIAILKGVFQLGIVHATILYWILIYPIFRFMKVKSFCSEALPAVAAIFFGFMSLLHYGSLFRVTSILLFYAIYSTCLVLIINCNESDLLLRQESIKRELNKSSP